MLISRILFHIQQNFEFIGIAVEFYNTVHLTARLCDRRLPFRQRRRNPAVLVMGLHQAPEGGFGGALTKVLHRASRYSALKLQEIIRINVIHARHKRNKYNSSTTNYPLLLLLFLLLELLLSHLITIINNYYY